MSETFKFTKLNINRQPLNDIVAGKNQEASEAVYQKLKMETEKIAQKAIAEMRARGADYQASLTQAETIRHPNRAMIGVVRLKSKDAQQFEAKHHILQSAANGGLG